MIAVCTNPYRDIGLKYTVDAVSLLEQAGFGTAVCPIFAKSDDACIPAGIPTTALADIVGECSLIVVIGGDGTILAVARELRDVAVPILGVNLGTMGFLTGLEPEDLYLVVKAARGEAMLSRRMMLDISLEREGKTVYQDRALNDAVIHGYGDCINLTSWCDGERINSFSGDGIIVSTPTGSTGYCLSAGGPIVEPDADSLIVAPICAHDICSRPFVLGASRTVRVMAERLRDRRAYLSVDGNSVLDLANEDVLVAKRSPHCTLMANLGRKSFYDTAYEKLI